MLEKEKNTMPKVEDIKLDKEESPQTRTEYLNIRLLVRQSLAYVPGSILPALIGLTSAAIFTRTFSDEEYGRYSLVLSVITLATALSSQWLQQAINRYLPGATNITTHQKVKRVAAVGIIIILGFLACVTLMLFSFRSFLPNEWREFVLPGALLMVATSSFNPIGVILQAEMKARLFSRYALANAIAKLFFSIFIVFVIVHSSSGMIWGAALSTAMLLPLLWYRGGLPSPNSLLHNKKLWSNYWRGIKQFTIYGFPMIGWFLATTLLNVGDRYVIQWFRGSGEVGIYSANYNLIQGAISLLAAPILLAAHPFLMKAWSESDKGNVGRWLGIIAEWFAVAGIILVGATWLFSADIANWFLGAEFRSGHIMPVVIAGIVAWQLGIYAHKPLEFAEKTTLMFVLSLATAGLNLILNIIFVPIHGYVAAAYTTFVSYLVYTFIAIIVGQRILSWHVKVKPIIIIAVFTISSIFGFSQLRYLVQENWGYNLGIMITVIGYTIVEVAALKLSGLNVKRIFSLVRM
jgi:O-antigen/teichoic acid export membrane protein